MRWGRYGWAALVMATALLAACSGEIVGAGGDGGTDGGTGGDGATGGDDGGPGDAGGGDVAPPPADAPTTTVTPTAIDDLLLNPGIGFADFALGWGSPPPASGYPPGTVGYVRWTWAELEPAEGQYDFARVDDAIAAARARGETLAFRIMPCYDSSSPQWLLDKGVASVVASDGVFPDHNSPTFLSYHEQLVRAFGARYSGSLDVDHVDIGSVGCWGEWNTACCNGTECDALFPTEANQRAIIDWYLEAFPGTPLVALVGAPSYAEEQGAGWRGDCFGDYGMFGSTWNHMENSYPQAAADPVIGNAWKTAPVQFEACGVMQDWYDRGFDIDLILQKGLEWHLSVFNGKSSPVPASWRPKVDAWLKQVGYRLVLTSLTHTAKASPGGSLALHAEWENRGVAPAYHPWPLAWRLRSAADTVVAQWTSAAALRTFLPGSHLVDDLVVVPAAVAPATYSLDVAVLTEDAAQAHVRLAIAGVLTDLWYPASTVTVE
ncbi:MAG: DUF4832 domain-containing protein [Deltaproteobacteria bacterium]|nr:DUF4832 domain-containing protein [Deltaproteobacteria bacterium]